MNSLLINIDSNVYKTNAIVQKDNNNVQNKDSNVPEITLKELQDICMMLNQILDDLEDLKTCCVVVIITEECFILPEKDTHVWDVCLNAYGKRVCA